MIQRILLTQVRSAAVRTAPKPFLAGSLIRSSQFVAQSPRLPVAARCYATNGEANKANEEGAAAPEDAAAKDLEAKNKEIVDLKVCRQQQLAFTLSQPRLRSMLGTFSLPGKFTDHFSVG